MPLYPTYMVNDIAMDDPTGRWHEHERMSILPTHPGLRATSLSLPGVGGEALLSAAPHEPGEFVLRMVVNAIDPNTGQMASGYANKLVALNTNSNALLAELEIARMTQGGEAVIERHLSAWDVHTARGRLVASSEPEYTPGADHALYNFVFRIPSGVWTGKDATANISGQYGGRIHGLSASTAPVEGPLVTITGPFTYLDVKNELHNGFRYSKPLTSGQYVTVNTKDWTVSPVGTYTDLDNLVPHSGPYTFSPNLSSVGVSSGVALTILPRHDGAIVYAGGSGRVLDQTMIRIHTTEAYF